VKQFSKLFENIFFKSSGKEGVASDAAKFLLAFALSAGAAYLLLSLTGNFFNEVAARSSEAIGRLFVQQISFAVYSASGFPQLSGVANGVAFTAQINGLCSGRLELAVMAGLVLASRDRSVRQRLKGILSGAILLLLFNPLRISLTLSSIGTPFLAIVHDALFRISLVLLLVVFYAFWHYWQAPAANTTKNALFYRQRK